MSKIVKFKEVLPKGYIYWGEDLVFERPKLGLGEYKGTVTRIMNACQNCIVEEDLSIYVSTNSLREILRINASNKINRILADISDDDKLGDGTIKSSQVDYIVFGEVLKLINRELIETRDQSRRLYLKVAEKSLINMRDCDKLVVLAGQKDIIYNKELKNLKGKRKRTYKIKIDELTGEKLQKDSHFSHIRSKASYPKLALDIENGLLVNKEIHNIITNLQIEDEDQLEELCKKERWSLEWKKKFDSRFIC